MDPSISRRSSALLQISYQGKNDRKSLQVDQMSIN